MKWEGQEQSRNVEDRRHGGFGGLGGGRGIGVGGTSIGLGTVAVALVAGWLFGINPLTLLGMMEGTAPPPTSAPAGPAAAPPAGDREAAFVSTVLRDTEVVWGQLLQGQYQEPRLVLFRGAVPTACGTGLSAMGPFYCPGDARIYLDLDFFDALAARMGAPGDFAQAYVVAHEVGHHLQAQLGVMERVDAARRRASREQGNALSVRVELQADCLAGVWAHHSQRGKGWLETGDVDEALNAASRIGDDVLQRASQGHVVPESFTHGSSQQRVSWFRRGLESGNVDACDTFGARP